jgi:hypothetical protein
VSPRSQEWSDRTSGERCGPFVSLHHPRPQSHLACASVSCTLRVRAGLLSLFRELSRPDLSIIVSKIESGDAFIHLPLGSVLKLSIDGRCGAIRLIQQVGSSRPLFTRFARSFRIRAKIGPSLPFHFSCQTA